MQFGLVYFRRWPTRVRAPRPKVRHLSIDAPCLGALAWQVDLCVWLSHFVARLSRAVSREETSAVHLQPQVVARCLSIVDILVRYSRRNLHDTVSEGRVTLASASNGVPTIFRCHGQHVLPVLVPSDGWRITSPPCYSRLTNHAARAKHLFPASLPEASVETWNKPQHHHSYHHTLNSRERRLT